MAALTTQRLVAAGTAPTFAAAAAGGDTAEVGPHIFLVVKNTNASPRTVTIATPGNLGSGDAYPDKAIVVGATNGEIWVPMVKDFNDPSTNRAAISYSADAGVTVAVVQA